MILLQCTMKKISTLLFLLAGTLNVSSQQCLNVASNIVGVTCNGEQDGAIDLSIDEPSIQFDGSLLDADWGSALTINTSGASPSFGAGHELKALYATAGTEYLYLGIAGDVQDQNRILLFIDCKPGGFNNGSFDRTGASFGLQAGNFNSGITFDSNFYADYCVAIGTNSAHNNFFVDVFPLVNSGSSNWYYGDNTSNLIEGLPVAGSTQDGFEIAIPWDSLGGLPKGNIKFFGVYQADNGFMSNQFLSPANLGESSYGNTAVNFNLAAPSPVSMPSLLSVWSNGDSTQDLKSIAGGTYTVTVSNSTGCVTTLSFVVAEPAKLQINTSIVPIICNGDSATVTASAIGGTAPYAGIGIFKFAGGSPNISITDSNGCGADTTLNFINPASLKSNSIIQPIVCNGDTTNIVLSLNGGIAPYQGVGTFTLTAGNYNFILQDSLGCTKQVSGVLTEPAAVIVTATPNNISTCSSHTVSLTASGASTYLWLPDSAVGTNITVSPIITSSYTVVGANAQNCKGSTSVIVNINASTNSLSLSASSNSLSTVGTQCASQAQSSGSTITYTDNLCNPMLVIADGASGLAPGVVDVCTQVFSAAAVYDSIPYAPRFFKISATNNNSATVTLFFTDDDFIKFNANRGAYDSIATFAGGNTSAIVSVLQYTDTPSAANLQGTYGLLSAVYNASNGWWQVGVPVSSLGNYYLTTQKTSALGTNAFMLQGFMQNNIAHLSFDALINEDVLRYEVIGFSQNAKAKVISTHEHTLNAYYNTLTEIEEGTYFYIKALLKNGTAIKSNTINLQPNANTDFWLNTVANTFTAHINLDKVATAHVQVFNAWGQQVYTSSSNLSKGKNDIAIAASNLTSGNYMVRCTVGNKVFHSKAFIQ
jgi:hypothetical protein